MFATRQPSGVSRLGARVEAATKSPYLAELPELVGVGLQDCNTCFVNKRRGRVPWLDLLAEDELHVLCVLGLDQWEDRVVDCVEHLLGELAEL